MNTETDELIYEEKDDTFTLYVNKSQSGKFLFVHSGSNTMSEIRLLDAEAPLSHLRLLEARRRGLYMMLNIGGMNCLI